MTGTMKRGCDHIFFVGFLGAGKSTLARNLGMLFNRRYVDTDRLVERRRGLSVSRIFELEGEQAFRQLETEALGSLACDRSLLVSCGGGIVETPCNIELIGQMGYCVYLDGDIDDSLRQIRRRDTRPDFRSDEHAARLLEHRRPLYQQAADFTVDIRGKSFKEVTYLCAEMLLERGLL
ncbi:shikimate kinase [Collinsella tanakaei]|uniref:Shikimate kinase n=1 Tax=Collinsella ihumii TaxID=1720204 RepID=A0A921IPJ2_9ACTN|nr:shikimate kinase [Collinsella tanakaei]MBM6775861.1 shikimate kinase [Collinsella tanakaei]MBM6784959.1 shikimate kinase [Collinsella tanakaei]MBM6904943.1 shikimate kinase [Collinsella tanakaei]HJG31235.1 shikimate kinase [Collinsella ihumii]